MSSDNDKIDRKQLKQLFDELEKQVKDLEIESRILKEEENQKLTSLKNKAKILSIIN